MEEYAFFRCEGAELEKLPDGAVIGRKKTPYGVSAIVRRDALPARAETSPVTLEELFVFMVKEGET